ncbi:hypothetical protein C8P64_1998 [Christiangramia gaetbulicola]|uniref:Uncharacterized protein n=1 Tax=Christiangramia gaetbulicola TaxID=703340 RepID=A0A2T6AI26_9FLAO|nr:hypothetical protein C8P64_1998 [Christiangramia gaetbulicola]
MLKDDNLSLKFRFIQNIRYNAFFRVILTALEYNRFDTNYHSILSIEKSQ